jgi:hypothetical protein
VRPLLVAFAACVFAAAPAALLAQQPAQAPLPPQRPFVRPIPPVRPRPVPTRPSHHRANQTQYPIGVYPMVIVNPTPTPAPNRKATPRPKNAQDVFETHSSDDAK